MKRYILFRFGNFYPSGGMNDVEGHYDTIEEATDYVEECKKDPETKERNCNLGKEDLYPEGYTYFDRFVDDIKKKHGGDLVFVAMSVADYELMSYNTQEIKRYITQLGDVVIYYKEVTTPSKPPAIEE